MFTYQILMVIGINPWPYWNSHLCFPRKNISKRWTGEQLALRADSGSGDWEHVQETTGFPLIAHVFSWKCSRETIDLGLAQNSGTNDPQK